MRSKIKKIALLMNSAILCTPFVSLSTPCEELMSNNSVEVFCSNTSKVEKKTYNIKSGEMDFKVLMAAGDGYPSFRIPTLVATNKGTLLAMSEARNSGSDWAPMDAVLMRSTDGGETWSERSILAAGFKEKFACNNQILIPTREGPIFLLYCKEYGVPSRNGGVFYRVSNDDGLTWSDPVDISKDCLPDYRVVFATGPGHGIQLKNGRLITAVWMVPKRAGKGPTSHHPGEVSTLYSDDMGKTWKVGEIISGENNPDLNDPNESTIVELSDGSVMINMRNVTGTGRRAISISKDGATNWSKPYFDEALIEPVCFGSLVRYDENTILFVNPDTLRGRTHGTIKVSYDDGKTWPVKRLLNRGGSSYADVAVSMVDGVKQISVLLETPPGNTLTFYRFPLSWVEEGIKHELKALDISEGSLTLESGKHQYRVELEKKVDSIIINAVPFCEQGKVYYKGKEVVDGRLEIPLFNGVDKQAIDFTVKSKGGKEVLYRIYVELQPNASRNSKVMHLNFDKGNCTDSSENKSRIATVGKVIYQSAVDAPKGQIAKMGNNGTTYFNVEKNPGLNFGTGDFTASAWIKPSKLEGQQFLFWYGDFSVGSKAWWCRVKDNNIDFLLSDEKELIASANNVLKEGKWANVTLVNRDKTINIYVDGKLVGSKVKSKKYNVNGANALYVGAQKTGASRVFKGMIDEVQLFNYALNDDDINKLFKKQAIPSAAKDILSFEVNGFSGVISKDNKIEIVKYGSKINTTEIKVSKGAKASPVSATKYVVTAEDGSKQEYTVSFVEKPVEIKPINNIVKEKITYNKPEAVKVYAKDSAKGKPIKMNFLGDSITYGQDPKNGGRVIKQYHAFLADYFKADCVNYGIRGSTISVLRRGGDRDPFTIRSLKMRQDADVIFVFGGTNDYGVGGNAPFGKWTDEKDTTFLGGLRVLIEGLIKKYPGKQIVFMTPIIRGDRSHANKDRRSLSQYVNAIKKMCEEYSVPVLDAYSAPEMNLLPNKEEYMSDRLHPSAAGQEVMAKWIYKQLQEKKIIQVVE